MHDTCTCAGDTDLNNAGYDPPGTGGTGDPYVEVYNDSTSSTAYCDASEDKCRASPAENGVGLAYAGQIEGGGDPSTSDVHVEATITSVATTNTNTWWMFCRAEADGDGYYAGAYGTDQTNDQRIFKLESGRSSVTSLFAGGDNVAANDKLRLRCVGNQICLDEDTGGGWTQVSCQTDSTFTAAGKAGVAMGDQLVGSDRLATAWRWTDLKIYEVVSEVDQIID